MEITDQFWGYSKGVIRGPIRAIRAYIKQSWRVKTNNLIIDLKVLEKLKQEEAQSNDYKEVKTIRAEINEVQTERETERQ